MKIVAENPESSYGLSITRVGGANDGERFTSVEVVLDDGSKTSAFKSSARSGYFKRVFVPFDFNHESIVP